MAAGGRKADIYRRLRAIRDDYLGLIRTRYPDIPRRVSGYNLDYLLPEKQFHVARALVGSESTLVTVLTAEISLVEIPQFRSLVVLGYPDIAQAADLVPLVNSHQPLAVEGLDDVLISLEREEHLGGAALDKLPEGSGWLMIQFGGDTEEEAKGRAQSLIDAAQSDGDHPKPHVAYIEDPAVEDNLWPVRELGLGATAYPPNQHETHEGWEDAAVPPERLGDYLRDFRTLLARHEYHGASLYGHFGHGCVHTRIPFELRTDEGIANYRSFAEDAADLVVSYGGSLSGEHGDGQSRGELLPKMFGPELIRAFGELKDVFDPDNRMNPGKVVHPYRLDENLTLRGWFPPRAADVLPLPARRRHVQRRRRLPLRRRRQVPRRRGRGDVPELPGHPGGGALHPGPRPAADGDGPRRGGHRRLALDRGPRRARPVPGLQGLPQGMPGGRGHGHLQGGVPGPPLRGPDQARGPLLDGLAARASPPGDRRARPGRNGEPGRPYSGCLLWPNGPGELIPRETSRASPGSASPAGTPRRRRSQQRAGRRVILWPDTFSNNFHPEVARDAVTVLERAGFTVDVPAKPVCCGLTWISTGQLGVAQHMLRRTIKTLLPDLRAGVPVVVLEPSCAAVFRADAAELLGSDDARLLAKQTRTLAELLVESGWPGGSAPQGQHSRAIAQVHCHQHAIMGFDADTEVLRRAGVDVDVLDTGCCGLAGNFGFERGHYDVSAACAERGLWPAAREAGPDTAILADGFSCRTQLAAGRTGRKGLHLAQLLARVTPRSPAGP